MRGRDRRLARLAAHFFDAAAEAERRRAVAKARTAIVDAVRLWLIDLGIDPATVSAIRRIEEEVDEPSPVQRAPRPDDPQPPFGEEVERLARYYLAHPAIDLGKASLIQVLAWCIARHNDATGANAETAIQPSAK